MYNFVTTAKTHYFSKNNDIVFLLGEFFSIKIKSLLEKDINIQKPIVSFIISKKIGNAVIRNKLKRRLKVIFNELAFSISMNNKMNIDKNILSDGDKCNNFFTVPEIKPPCVNFKQFVHQNQTLLYQNFCYILVAKPVINSLSFSELKNKIKIEINNLFKHKRFVNHLKHFYNKE